MSLNPDRVREIRARISEGAGDVTIAREFGVTDEVVGFIRCGQTWRHILRINSRE
jgi:hypothetical protein